QQTAGEAAVADGTPVHDVLGGLDLGEGRAGVQGVRADRRVGVPQGVGAAVGWHAGVALGVGGAVEDDGYAARVTHGQPYEVGLLDAGMADLDRTVPGLSSVERVRDVSLLCVGPRLPQVAGGIEDERGEEVPHGAGTRKLRPGHAAVRGLAGSTGDRDEDLAVVRVNREASDAAPPDVARGIVRR